MNIIEAKESIEIVQKCIEKSLVVSGADIKKFGEELGRNLALSFNDFANKKFKNNQMEVLVSLISIATTAWCAYILESKAICHYRKSQETYRDFLENNYIPNIIDVIITGRNLAIDEKKRTQNAGDSGKDGDVPIDIKIPEHLPNSSITYNRDYAAPYFHTYNNLK